MTDEPLRISPQEVSNLSEKKVILPNQPKGYGKGFYEEKDVREAVLRLKEEDKEVIIYNNLIDKYFPKGDKRRGEVLVILADINAKQTQNKNDIFGEDLI